MCTTLDRLCCRHSGTASLARGLRASTSRTKRRRCGADGDFGRGLRGAMVHDQPRPALTREVGPHPLEEHAHAEARLTEELEVHGGPREPGDEPGKMQSSALQHGETFSDDGHAALVEVAERTRSRLPRDPPPDEFPRIPSLLHRDLRDAGERPPVLPQYGRVADHEDVRMP